jgi:hypothetical protein
MIAGLKAFSAARNISSVFCKGYLGGFRLAQSEAIAVFPTVLAVC